jgi:hypothetical protein
MKHIMVGLVVETGSHGGGPSWDLGLDLDLELDLGLDLGLALGRMR